MARTACWRSSGAMRGRAHPVHERTMRREGGKREERAAECSSSAFVATSRWSGPAIESRAHAQPAAVSPNNHTGYEYFIYRRVRHRRASAEMRGGTRFARARCSRGRCFRVPQRFMARTSRLSERIQMVSCCKNNFAEVTIFLDTEFHQNYTFVSCMLRSCSIVVLSIGRIDTWQPRKQPRKSSRRQPRRQPRRSNPTQGKRRTGDAISVPRSALVRCLCCEGRTGVAY